jgi:hypothetical protein
MIFQECLIVGGYRVYCWEECGDFGLHVTCKPTHTPLPLRYSGPTKPKNPLGAVAKLKRHTSVAPNRTQFSGHVGAALGCVGRYEAQEGSFSRADPR